MTSNNIKQPTITPDELLVVLSRYLYSSDDATDPALFREFGPRTRLDLIGAGHKHREEKLSFEFDTSEVIRLVEKGLADGVPASIWEGIKEATHSLLSPYFIDEPLGIFTDANETFPNLEPMAQKHDSLIQELVDHRKISPHIVLGYKVIDIRSAAAQFCATYPMGSGFEAPRVFPNVAPPFKMMLFEFGCPLGLEQAGVGRVVVFMTAGEPDPERTQRMNVKPTWELIFTILSEVGNRVMKYPAWVAQCAMADGALVCPDAKTWWIDGRMLEDDDWPAPFRHIPTAHMEALAACNKLGQYLMDWFVAPCLFAISLLHCKNVSLKSLPPRVPPHSRKVEKRQRGLPFIEHHTIEVRERKGRVIDPGPLDFAIRNRLHIVRGHYSTYLDKAPLFGRVTGTFWIPAHVRGSIGEGIILSDYKV